MIIMIMMIIIIIVLFINVCGKRYLTKIFPNFSYILVVQIGVT